MDHPKQSLPPEKNNDTKGLSGKAKKEFRSSNRRRQQKARSAGRTSLIIVVVAILLIILDSFSWDARGMNGIYTMIIIVVAGIALVITFINSRS